VFAIVRKALADLATMSLEERMGEVFTRRLREINGQAKSTLGEALKKNSEAALVRSTFDLPAAQRAAIQNAVNETLQAEIHINFETAPDLVSGIELIKNGQKVGWSISDYLASLEKSVGVLLKEKDKPAPKPEVKPDPEVKPETKPVPKPEVKAAATPKPDTTNGSASDVKSKVEFKPETKAEPKAEASKSVIQSQ
jgi:F-type H+-transporting ATPase subunit b